MEGKSVVPVSTDQKKAVREYVGQLKDMEIERLKLKRLNEELLVKKGEGMTEKIELKNKVKSDLDKKRADYQESVKKKQQGEPHFDTLSCVLLGIIKAAIGCIIGFVGGWLLHGIVFLVASFVDYMVTDGFAEMIIPILPMIKWVTLPIGGVVGILLEIKGSIEFFNVQKKKYSDIDLIIKRKERRVEETNRYLRQIANDIEAEKQKAQTIEKQIELNEKHILQFGVLIQKMHEIDIIPPDYRTVDCIITLDHIFKNDLADTVRDAVLLYKDWVYHETIIVGIENIYQMLGNLSASMQYMQRTLESIDQSVSALSDDMTRMVGLQKESNRTQEQILRESQCTREATESIRRSNEKYEWYAEQHRQGLF